MTRARVLVVEEDDEAGALASDLAAHGFDVTTAAGSRRATEAMTRSRYDVALAGMQGERGAALLSILKGADPQMAVVSVSASPDAIGGLIRGGAYACVAKPYSLPGLRALLDSAVHSRSRLDGCVTLYEVSRSLLATLKQADLVRLIIDLSDQVLPSDGVGLLLVGPATTAGFECHSSLGAREVSRAIVAALAERARKAQRTLSLPAEGESLPDDSEAAGFSSALAYPLSGPDGALGALTFFRRDGSSAFSALEIDRGGMFAVQVSLALENARLYREVEEKMDRLVRGQDRARLRGRLRGVGAMGSVVAHEVNNPLAALSCNLDALRTYSSGFGALWQAAKAAAEFLREQAEPTGQRLSLNILTAAGSAERTDHLVTEVVAAIDECLDGVRRIAEFVRGLHDPSALGVRTDLESLPLDDAIAELLAERTNGRRNVIQETHATVVAKISRKDLAVAVGQVLAALDRLPTGSSRDNATPPTITIRAAVRDGRPAIVITDPALDLSPPDELLQMREPGLVIGLGRRIALDCALALAGQLLERNGGELAAEAGQTAGTRLWFTLRF